MSNPTGSRGCSQRLRFDAMDLTRQAPVLPWLKAELMSDPLVGQRTNPHCPPGTSPDSLCSDHSVSNCSRFAMSKARPWKRLPWAGADVEGDNGDENRALHAFFVHFLRRQFPFVDYQSTISGSRSRIESWSAALSVSAAFTASTGYFFRASSARACLAAPARRSKGELTSTGALKSQGRMSDAVQCLSLEAARHPRNDRLGLAAKCATKT